MGIAFEEAKKSYEQMREQERKKLIKYLKNHTALINSDLDVVTGGSSGNGDKNYTSGGRIAPYDLSNWKWVECKNPNGGFSAVVSLNMPDNDLASGNPHSLYDRVGVAITYKCGNDYYKTSIWTDIDLPFDNASMNRLAKIIETQFNFYEEIKR